MPGCLSIIRAGLKFLFIDQSGFCHEASLVVVKRAIELLSGSLL